MATIKLKFRPSSTLGAMGTLYYQVTHKRSVKWISTSHRAYAGEWDKLSGSLIIPQAGERRAVLMQISAVLAWEIEQRQAVIDRLCGEHREFTLDELCAAFGQLPVCKTVFVFLREQVVRQERMQRLGTARTFTSAYLRFREFCGSADLTFDQLSADMIEEYEAWLTHRGLRQNIIRFYLRTLRTLLGKAVCARLLRDVRPLFSRVRLSYVPTAKRAITEADLRAIQKLQLPEGSTLALARDLFMFSFYMRGMPFVDIAFLKKSDLKNGLLSYCRRKTNQHLCVAWEREQQEIVERYAHLTAATPYMLPIILKTDGTEYRQYQRMEENVNRALKKIGRLIGLRIPLTTNVARHSWASIARDINIPIAVISEGMGHQSYSTTQVYLNTIATAKVNEANLCVIRRISEAE